MKNSLDREVFNLDEKSLCEGLIFEGIIDVSSRILR